MGATVVIPGCRIRSHTSDGSGWRLRRDSKGRVSYEPSQAATLEACTPASLSNPSLTSPLAGEVGPKGRVGGALGNDRSEDLRLRLRLRGTLMPPAPPPQAADHHPPVGARTPAATRVEPLGHAAKLRAPRHVFVKALLSLLGEPDSLAAGLLAETGDTAGRRTFLLL